MYPAILNTNIDTETGIRYGVIPANEIGRAWYDDSEPQYGPPSCPNCGSEAIAEAETWPDKDNYFGYLRDMKTCPDCDESCPEDATYPEDAIGASYEDEGYAMHQGQDDSDVWVLRSPYYTYCRLCSPCAPNAGYITSQATSETGYKTYCPGPDWFNDDTEAARDVAIYDVATNERLYTDAQMLARARQFGL